MTGPKQQPFVIVVYTNNIKTWGQLPTFELCKELHPSHSSCQCKVCHPHPRGKIVVNVNDSLANFHDWHAPDIQNVPEQATALHSFII